MQSGLPPLSLARDSGVSVARVFDPLAHPGPLGEGWTAYDDKEHQVTPVTLSAGVGVHDAMPCHPSPLSTAPQGLDTMVPPWLCIVTTTFQHLALLLHNQAWSGKCTTCVDALSFPESVCYTQSPSPRDATLYRMPSSA